MPALRFLTAMCVLSIAASAEPVSSDTTTMQELEKVVVTATRRETTLKDAPEITVVVSGEEIGAIHATDVEDILAGVPGVNTESGTGGGLPFKHTVTVNGMPVQYSLVMVDGTRLLSSHIHTGVNVNLVPPENIERIEVIKGAASAQYGSDALGGILNIITKRGTTVPRLDVEAWGGSRSTLHTGLSVRGPIGEAARHSVYAGWEQSHGVAIKEPASRIDAFHYNRLNLMDRVEIDLTDKVKTYASVHYFRAEAPFSVSSSVSVVDTSIGLDTTVTSKETVDHQSWLLTPKAGVEAALTDNVDLSVSAYYTQWNNEKNEELNEIFSPELTVGLGMLKYNYLLVGGEGAYRNFTRKNVDEHSQKMGALFIQDEFSPVEQLRVLGAVRLDMVEDLDPVVTPKLSLLYRPLDPIRLRCSVGRGFRAPTVQDLHEKYYGHDPYYRDGNPDLLPEYSTNVTGGVEYVPLTGLNLMLNGYYNDITDMITPVTHGDTLIPSISADSILVYRRENVHEAFVAGFELACSWRFLERFRLDGGFSLIHNENRETGASLPYYPGKTAFARASVTQPVTSWLKMNAFAGVKATMDRETWQYQTEETIALADYQKVDLGLGMTVGDRYEVYFAVDNALAQELEMYEDKLLVTEGERFYRWGLRASVY